MSTKGKNVAISGVVLQLGLLVDFIGTVVGKSSAEKHISEGGSLELLADDMGFALIITVIGLGIALVGLIFVFIALFGSKYRAPWFFWFLIVGSLFWMLHVPVGTLFGFGFLIYLIMHKEEFRNPMEDG